MKKILIIISSLLLCCACGGNQSLDAVENYLTNYKNLTEEITTNIEEIVNEEDLSPENKELYKDILKRQYKDLQYTIENENYNGDEDKVTIKITVYDYYKVQKDAQKYLEEHPEEFMSNSEFNRDKYDKYKLQKMLETNEAISYNIVFKLKKINGQWQVEQPSQEVLEKIHGIYNYELD